MIRKLILPALAALMLAGCATYQYRAGSGGDYYYGQPGTEYRYYGSPYGYGGYGYGGYGGSGYGSYGYGGYGYGYPSYFGYRNYYGYPYGSGGYYRPPTHGHGHGGGHSGGGGSNPSNPDPGQTPPVGNETPDRPTAPWRDLDRLRERARVHDRTYRPTVESGVLPRQRTAPVVRTAPVRTGPVRTVAPSIQSRPRTQSVQPRTTAPARLLQKRDSRRNSDD